MSKLNTKSAVLTALLIFSQVSAFAQSEIRAFKFTINNNNGIADDIWGFEVDDKEHFYFLCQYPKLGKSIDAYYNNHLLYRSKVTSQASVLKLNDSILYAAGTHDKYYVNVVGLNKNKGNQLIHNDFRINSIVNALNVVKQGVIVEYTKGIVYDGNLIYSLYDFNGKLYKNTDNIFFAEQYQFISKLPGKGIIMIDKYKNTFIGFKIGENGKPNEVITLNEKGEILKKSYLNTASFGELLYDGGNGFIKIKNDKLYVLCKNSKFVTIVSKSL